MEFITNVIKTFFTRKIHNKPINEEKIILQPQAMKDPSKNQNINKVYKDEENTKLFQVKKHLIEKGQIDSWTAINLYGATRLSSIIFDLRKKGYNIRSVRNTAYDRNNKICNFTTYIFKNNGIN
jgi:hypothetical protein